MADEERTGIVAFLKADHRILLLRRGSAMEEKGMWDGVTIPDITDPQEAKESIGEMTNVSASSLSYMREGRPIDGFVPMLFELPEEEADEAEAGGGYDDREWIDTGQINNPNYELVPGRKNLLAEVYSFIYILKTTIGHERSVAQMLSYKVSNKKPQVYAILCPPALRGYVMVEGPELHGLENVIKGVPHVRGILKGAHGAENNFSELEPFLEPKASVVGIDVSDYGELTSGPFKGEKAKVTAISEGKEEITVELIDTPVPIPVTIKADFFRVIQKGGMGGSPMDGHLED